MQKMWAGNKLPKRFFVHGKNTSYLAGCAGTGIGDAYCCRIMVIPTLLNQSADDSNKIEATKASETEYTDSSTVTDPSVATEPKICRL